MDTEVVRVGDARPGTLRCRLFGHKEQEGIATVTAHLRDGDGMCYMRSSREPVVLCRRCRRMDTAITVPATVGQSLDKVEVAVEVML